MFTDVHPKLPMRDMSVTLNYYVNNLGFRNIGNEDYEGYLMLRRDLVEIHFFEYLDLDPSLNYGQVYIRTQNIEEIYQTLVNNKVAIHPNGKLQKKSWGQKEFSLLDPDNNLLTFGGEI